jgi:hypothetical protein
MLLLAIGFVLFYYPLMVLFTIFTGYVMLGPVSWMARAVGRMVGWKPVAIEDDDLGEHL